MTNTWKGIIIALFIGAIAGGWRLEMHEHLATDEMVRQLRAQGIELQMLRQADLVMGEQIMLICQSHPCE